MGLTPPKSAEWSKFLKFKLILCSSYWPGCGCKEVSIHLTTVYEMWSNTSFPWSMLVSLLSV